MGTRPNEVIQRFVSGRYLKIDFIKDSEFSDHNVTNLKGLLRDRRLKVSGNRGELIGRIKENFSQEEIRSIFGNEKKYFIATSKCDSIIAEYKSHSINKNEDLENQVLTKVKENKLCEAYKIVCKSEIDKQASRGMGIDWEREYRDGLSSDKERVYSHFLTCSRYYT